MHQGITLAHLWRGLKLLGVAVAVGLITGLTLSTTAPPAGNASSATTQPHPLTDLSRPGLQIAPMQDLDLPDPMLLAAEGRYYMYLSTAFEDKHHFNVPVESGTEDDWSAPSDAMPVMPSWADSATHGGKTWAPYAVKMGRNYLLYFSAMVKGVSHPIIHCLGVARSTQPQGPFQPVGSAPIVCQKSQGGDIDVEPVYDPSGPDGKADPWYLVWKSDDNNLPTHPPTSIWSAPLSNDGLAVSGGARVIFQADENWEKPVLEAPQMVRGPDGRVWLFFSGGKGFNRDQYAMGVALCTGPLGVCHTYGTGPLVSSNAQGSGPGEETLYIGADASYWLVYNPWHTSMGYLLYRPAEAVRIGWGRTGPYVADPGTFPSPPPPTGSPTAPTGPP